MFSHKSGKAHRCWVRFQLDAAKYANDLLKDLDKELHWMITVEKKLLDQTCPQDDATLIRSLYDEQQVRIDVSLVTSVSQKCLSQ